MTKEVHVDEAGIHGSSPIIVVGVLVVEDAETLRTVVKAVRDRHHFGNEIKSAKSSALRWRVYLDILSEVVQHNVQGHVLIARKDEASRYLSVSSRALDDRLTEMAVMHLSGALQGSVFYLDQKPGRGRRELVKRLVTNLNGLISVEEVDSRQYDLMQVCDLICGTVFGVETGNERKQELFRIIKPILTIHRWSPGK